MSELFDWTLTSLRIAACATAAAAIVAVPLAFATARRRGLWLKVVETILLVPLALPPIVVGYLLLILMGNTGPLGTVARMITGRSMLFTELSAVIAAMVVVLPLVYLPTKEAFASIDKDLEDTARLWGAGPLTLFALVSLPLARRGIAAGVLLAFARALGEFGATVLVLGIQGRVRTLPIAIYVDYEAGDMYAAWPAVMVLIGASLIAVILYGRMARSH